jgi:hypothetical protein
MLRVSNLLLGAVFLVGSNLAFAEAENLTPLNAKFETTTCDLPCDHLAEQVKVQWWLFRNHQQIETRKDNSNNSQLWLKSADNKLNYFYLLHDEKRAIEYTAVDLNMLGIATNQRRWQTLTSLVAQDDLAKMKKTHTNQVYETYQLEHYSGLLNGIQTQVLWIAELQIPLQITYTYPKQQMTVDLIKRYSNNSPLLATTQQNLMTYQQVDYADIGDIEHSTTSSKWLDKTEGAPGIHSHNH